MSPNLHRSQWKFNGRNRVVGSDTFCVISPGCECFWCVIRLTSNFDNQVRAVVHTLILGRTAITVITAYRFTHSSLASSTTRILSMLLILFYFILFYFVYFYDWYSAFLIKLPREYTTSWATSITKRKLNLTTNTLDSSQYSTKYLYLQTDELRSGDVLYRYFKG